MTRIKCTATKLICENGKVKASYGFSFESFAPVATMPQARYQLVNFLNGSKFLETNCEFVFPVTNFDYFEVESFEQS